MIEVLEPRIAPAAVFTFTDVDGDTVKVTTSKGTNDQLAAILKFVDAGSVGGKQLQEIDFSTAPLVNGANPFLGTNLSISVVKNGPFGDGRVNVGYIDASSQNGTGFDGTGLALGKVVVDGDLGQIDAGTGGNASSVKSLSVTSMGAFGLTTQGANGSNSSTFFASVGSVKIATSLVSTSLLFIDSAGNLTIGDAVSASPIVVNKAVTNFKAGSLFASSALQAGSIDKLTIKDSVYANITISGELGSGKIGGNVIGTLLSANSIGTLSIGGNVEGIDGIDTSGGITSATTIGKISIGGDLIGKDANNTGVISAQGSIGQVKLGGSLRAGVLTVSRFNTGLIFAGGDLGSVIIGGDLVGPKATSSSVGSAGASIRATGDIGSVQIKGSVIASDTIGIGSSGSLNISGNHVGSVKVDGSVSGTSLYFFSVFGVGGDGELAIDNLSIGGSANYFRVLAGAAEFANGVPRNADAEVGTIKVGGNLSNGSIEIGLTGNGITDNGTLTASLDKLIVGGSLGPGSSVRAEHLVSVKIGDNKLALQPGASNDTMAITLPGGSTIAEFA